MSDPDAQLARALFAWPGHVYADRDGIRWRWNGEQWEPLRPGDTILDPDRVTWRLWNGHGLIPAKFEAGAVVRVTWHRDGLDWVRQLCTVVDVEHGDEAQLLVEPWLEGAGVAVVPAMYVELVAPAARS